MGGEVEKEGFFFCVGGVKELTTLSVEDLSDFVENVGAVELFAIFGGTDDFTTMDPAGASGLVWCVSSTLFEDRIWSRGSVAAGEAVEEIEAVVERSVENGSGEVGVQPGVGGLAF